MITLQDGEASDELITFVNKEQNKISLMQQISLKLNSISAVIYTKKIL